MTYTNKVMLSVVEIQTQLNTKTYSNSVGVKATIGYNSDLANNSLSIEPVRTIATDRNYDTELMIFVSMASGSPENRVNDMFTNEQMIRNAIIIDKTDWSYINHIEYISTDYYTDDGTAQYALDMRFRIKIYN